MMSSNDRILDEMSGIKIDSYTSRLMQQRNELEQMLNTEQAQDELTDIAKKDLEREAIDTMNSECPHYQQAVLVTGNIIAAYYDEINEKFDLEELAMDHAVVMSWGFTTLEMLQADGTEKAVVGHLFLLEQMAAQRDTPSLVDYVPRLYGFGIIGQLEIDYEAPDAINIEVLEQNIPDHLERVDMIVANADDECEALMRLGAMSVSSTEDIPQDVLSRLLSYVSSRLDFDVRVPYEILVQGMFYDEDNSTHDKGSLKYFAQKPGRLIAYPGPLSLLPYPKRENRETIITEDAYWAVEVRVMGDTPTDPERKFNIPVRNIRYMKSLRKQIYDI